MDGGEDGDDQMGELHVDGRVCAYERACCVHSIQQ